MRKILHLLIMRRCLRNPWQVILGVLGVSLGVGIVLAIDLTNASALRAFEISSQSIVNGFSHQIIGGAYGLDESLYRKLRTELGLHRLLPIVEGNVAVSDGGYYRMIGIDPVSMMGADAPGASGRYSGSLLRLIAEPDTVLMADTLKKKLKPDASGRITVFSNGRRRTLDIIGIMPARGNLQGQLLQSGFLTDIATAQEQLGMQGRLSRIDLTLSAAEIGQLSNILNHSEHLMPSEAPLRLMTQMTRAFRINLTALSLLAMVIGAFLIYNTITISVLQRREQFATLRILGTDHGDVFLMIISEALALAVMGILCGYGLGIGLSQFLIKLSSRTLTDLYFVSEVQHLYLNGWSFIKATALGLGGVLAAAYLPARDAMTTAPLLTRSRSFLEQKASSGHGRLFIYSMTCAGIAMMILVLTDRSIIAGFAALFLIIISFAMASPLLLIQIVRIFKPVVEFFIGLPGSIAARGVLASFSRTRVAVTALAVAISATIGVSIMIGSFRHSVETWLLNYLRADVYISAAARGGDFIIGDTLLQRLRSLTGVEKTTTACYRDIWNNDKPARLRVVDIDKQVFTAYPLKYDAFPRRWLKFSSADGVLISEPYAYHNRLKQGDFMSLNTAAGAHRFQVVGIYVDYGSDQGVITMHQDIYRKYWRDAQVTSVALYIGTSISAGALAEMLNTGLLQGTDFHARANRELREQSMKIFDRTFSITQVLRILTVIIAVIGIFGALMSIQLERNREFAILRANGLTPGGLRQLILTEGGLMGVAAGIIALPLGILLAAVLIYVINRRSFGWTMNFLLEPRYLLSAVLLGLIAGVLAGIYPAWRMGVVKPADALRDE